MIGLDIQPTYNRPRIQSCNHPLTNTAASIHKYHSPGKAPRYAVKNDNSRICIGLLNVFPDSGHVFSYTCCLLWLMLRQFIIIYNIIPDTDQRYWIIVMHVWINNSNQYETNWSRVSVILHSWVMLIAIGTKWDKLLMPQQTAWHCIHPKYAVFILCKLGAEIMCTNKN